MPRACSRKRSRQKKPTTTTTTTTTNSVGHRQRVRPRLDRDPDDAVGLAVTYEFTETTTYVDEAGNPVEIETVKSGVPVTVYYSKDGDKMVATKVVVKKTTTIDAARVVI